MNFTLHAAGGLTGAALVFGSLGAVDHANRATPVPLHLSIAALDYVEIKVDGVVHGAFRQQIKSSTNRPMPATWSVQITRITDGVSVQLCSGQNKPGRPGSYDGSVDVWLLDDWVNDDCPDRLLPGDIAQPSWTSVNEFGVRETVSTSYRVPADAKTLADF